MTDILVVGASAVPSHAIGGHVRVHHRAQVLVHILANLVAVVEKGETVHHLWLTAYEARDVLHGIGYQSKFFLSAFYAPFALGSVFSFFHRFSVFGVK